MHVSSFNYGPDEKYRSRNFKHFYIYMSRQTESESSARNDKLRNTINDIFESRTSTICSYKTDNVQFPSRRLQCPTNRLRSMIRM